MEQSVPIWDIDADSQLWFIAICAYCHQYWKQRPGKTVQMPGTVMLLLCFVFHEILEEQHYACQNVESEGNGTPV